MIKTEKLTAGISMEEYLSGGYVEIDRFLACCKECPNYAKRWSCPPYDFDVEAYWRNFSRLTVVAVKIIPDDAMCSKEYDEQEGSAVVTEMRAMERERLMGELEAMEQAHPGSRLLSVGCCSICTGGCTRLYDQPCAHPDQMRYSIESLGGNVEKTARTLLGTELKWMRDKKLPEYTMLIGGLLEI